MPAHPTEADAPPPTAALRLDDPRLTRAMAASGAHTFEIIAGHVTCCGDGLRALFGVPAGMGFDLQTWSACVHPDDATRMEAEFARLTQQGGSTAIRYRLIRPDGSMRWLMTHAEAIAASGDTPASILGLAMDITERETVEERLHAALESTTDSVFALSADWDFTYLNRSARDTLPDGPRLLGRNLWAAFPEAVGGPFWDAYQRCMNSRAPAEAEAFYAPLQRYFVVRAFPAKDGGITVFFRDITEQREASARLLQAETMLRVLGEVSPDLLYAKDREGRMLYANPSVLAVIGRPAAEVIGRTDAEWLAVPAQAQAIMEYDRSIMQAGVTRIVEEIVTDARTGLTRVWQSTKTPLHAPDTGEIVGLVGVSRDVTDARQAGRALAESEARYRNTFDHAAVGVAEVGLDGRWLHVNRCLCEMLGYQKAELLALRVQDVTHPDDVAESLYALEQTLTGKAARCSVEQRYVRRDGTPLWVGATIALLRDAAQAPQHLIAVIEDISIRKMTEARLADSEARFRGAVRAVSGIVWTNNAQGEMEGEQPGWAALTGQSQAEYRGYGWARAVHPDDAQPTIDTWKQAVEDCGNFVFEHRLRRHDGVWRHYAVRATPVLRADGTVREWVGVHTDITEQREAEAVLARDRTELERLVQARTLDLQQAQARLAQAEKLSALGQLAGGIAHDFNNVMQAVQGGASLILRRPDNTDSVQRFARMIAEAAQRGTSVTRRLLAFAHRGELRAGAVDVGALLDGLQQVLSHTLGAGVLVQVEIADDLPPVMADSGQLETALINLSTNARDAMPEGGTLVLSAARETVADNAHAEDLAGGDYVRIAVADTGTGMDAATLSRVMEPFFTTKPRGEGTGLGLPMARGFAEQSGGALALDSQVGRGTVVTVWLPVARSGIAPQQMAVEPPSGGAPASCRVLLVDDEVLVRKVLALQLTEEGYEVCQAASGAAALQLLDDGEAVDLLVSDLAMPEMDGVALIKAVQNRLPTLPAILLTGYAGAAASLALGKAIKGPFGLLRKPVTGSQLADRIATLLEAAPR